MCTVTRLYGSRTSVCRIQYRISPQELLTWFSHWTVMIKQIILFNEDGLCPVCSRNEIFMYPLHKWASGFRFHTSQKDERAKRGKFVMTLSFPVSHFAVDLPSSTTLLWFFVLWPLWHERVPSGEAWTVGPVGSCQWHCTNYRATTRMRKLEEKW